MKKTILGILTFASISLFMTSCGTDEPADNTTTGSFELKQDDFKGNINDGKVVLKANTTYKLTGPLFVKSGAELVIQEGATVESQGNGAEGFIAIEQGAKINAVGTASNPIVFTSSDKTPGSWGGIVLCGKAPTNKGASAQAEVTGLLYGGNVSNDNSGTMKYCRIEYSGNKISGTKEFNGLNCFGVGSGTTLEYIQVINGSDDAFEWFGGTVNAKYLVATSCEDDLFDCTEGWSGSINYAYGNFGSAPASSDSRGIEFDNLEANFAATPVGNPTISNMTLVARASAPSAGEQKEGMKIRRGIKGKYSNIHVHGFSKGISVESDESIAAFNANTLTFTNVQVMGASTDFEFKKSNGVKDASLSISLGTSVGAGSSHNKPTWAMGWTK